MAQSLASGVHETWLPEVERAAPSSAWEELTMKTMRGLESGDENDPGGLWRGLTER